MIYLSGKTEYDYKSNFIHWDVTPPELDQEIIEVPLRDGFINATRFLSDRPVYKSRTITIGLEQRGLREEWPAYYSRMLQDLHGRDVVIARSEEPEYYWLGVASVGPQEDHGASAGVTITVTAQPFKRHREKRPVVSQMAVTGTATINVNVDDMRGYPTFNVSGTDMRISVNGETWALPDGESTAYGLELLQGSTEITVTGNGTISMEYEGGSL